MVEAGWGAHEDPGRFGQPGLESTPVETDRPEDVPAVTAAREHGFHPAPEAPLWCFVPALWPTGWRAWVPDVRVRSMARQCGDGPVERLHWSAGDHAEHERDTNGLLAELGLPPRPAGRIWLLRAPDPYPDPQAVLDEIWQGWLGSGGLAMATPAFVAYVDGKLRDLF